MFAKTPWNYRKEGSQRSDGYIRVSVAGKRILKHRLLAQEKLGRPLRDDEIVHHIDGDTTNNDLDKLQVMSQSEHLRLHIKQWDARYGTQWRRGEDHNSIRSKKLDSRAA